MERENLIRTLKNYSPGSFTAQPVKIRQAKLADFARKIAAAKPEIYAALVADLNRELTESLMAELIPLIQITRYLKKHLPRLSRPRKLRGAAATFPAAASLIREPFGRVLVISTWNYPLLLALEPVLGAYAAGNRVFLKLSPRSQHTNLVISKLIKSVFGSDEISVIGNELSLQETISFRYDFIFLTGNSSTGKVVMTAAAKNLTPCAMELGGKNPCIVNDGCNINIAARRIVWGKFFNAGQSCAAPDYLLVKRELKDQLLNRIAHEIRRMYGNNPLENNRIAAMPDNDAYSRITRMISEGRLVCGGDRYPQLPAVEPTVIDQLSDDSPLFHEEIFGPVLPVKTFSTDAELFNLLAAKERPLVISCFGGSKEFRRELEKNFPCGALLLDDVLLHFCNMHIPFGGVGNSGFGAYHGEKTFTTFTHEKPVLRQSRWLDLPLRYPPHSRFIRRLLEIFNHLG